MNDVRNRPPTQLTIVVFAGALAACSSTCDKDRGSDSSTPVGTASSPSAGVSERSKPPAPPDAQVAPVVDSAEFPVAIRGGAETKVQVSWSTPAGTGVNEDAPFKIRWSRSEGLAEAPSDFKSTGHDVLSGFHVTVMPAAGVSDATLAGTIDLVVCDVETHSVCVPVHRSLELAFHVTESVGPEVRVTMPLPAAKPAPPR